MSSINQKLTGYSVSLEPITQENQGLLFQWRNQIEIRRQMVNQKIIIQAEHNAWFLSLAKKRDQQHFVVYYKDIAIGAVNIKTHNGQDLTEAKDAEIGLYIGNEKYRDNIISFAPSLVINDFAFEKLAFAQLSSKVRADNLAALKYNQQLGYSLSTEKHGFIEITLNKENYFRSSQQLKQFLNRGNRRVDSKT